jgi:protein SSD1
LSNQGKYFGKQQQQQQQQNRSSGLHTVNEEDYYNNQRKSSNRDSIHFQQDYRQRDSIDSPLIQRKQRSSVAHFNNFPLTKRPDDFDDNSNQLSRADVLAETEAKLNGHNKVTNRFNNGHTFDSGREDAFTKQNRHLSEPSSRIYQSTSYSQQQHQQQQQQQQSDHCYERPLFNKRMSFQYGSSSSSSITRDENRRLSLSSSSKLHMDNDSRSSVRDWRSKSPTTSTSSSSNSNNRPHSTVGLMNHRLSIGSSILEGGSNNGGHQRKPLFTSHLPFSSVVPHLKSNLLVSGLLRVNKRNRSDAYVFCEDFNADIYICGSRDRNRALEGDHVAIKLIEVDHVMLEKHEKEEAKLARNNGNPVVRKPDEEDEKEIIFGGEEDVDLVTPRFCGLVVSILDRAQKQVFSGTLGLTRPSNKRSRAGGDDPQQQAQRESSVPRIIWFKPTDKRVPLIAIPVEQAPAGFIENSEAFENRLFLVSLLYTVFFVYFSTKKKRTKCYRVLLNDGLLHLFIHLVCLKMNWV